MSYRFEDPDGSYTIDLRKKLLRITKYKDIPDSEELIEQEVNQRIEKEIDRDLLWIYDFINDRIKNFKLKDMPLDYMWNLLKHSGFIDFDNDDTDSLGITESGMNKIKDK